MSSFIPARENAGSDAVIKDGGNILYDDLAWRYLHTHALHRVGQCLHREVSLLPIARPAKAYHKAVADELIVANAFNFGDVAEQHEVFLGRSEDPRNHEQND